MALTTIKAAAMAANSVDSDQYVDGSIDNAHLADDAVDADKLANSINTDIAAKAPIAGPTFTGTVAIPNIANLETAVTAKAPKASPTFTGTSTFDTVVCTFSGRKAGVSIASTDGSGCTIQMDGGSNGDFSGSDYTYIEHESGGDLVFNVGSSSQTSSEKLRIYDSGGGKITGNFEGTGTVSDSKGEVRNIPASTNSTLVAADAGKHISITAGITINASTDFAIGDAVTIFNNQAAGNDETITATGIDLYLATDPSVSGATNRTLAPRGVVTILCVAADKYVITGAGLS